MFIPEGIHVEEVVRADEQFDVFCGTNTIHRISFTCGLSAGLTPYI